MGKADRSFNVSYTLDDLTRMLGLAIKHPNSQRLSEFIAFQLMEKGDGEDAHLLKLLQGINSELVYTEGQTILVKSIHLHSWLITDDLMIKNNLMVEKGDSKYVVCKVKEADVKRVKSYQVEYETIHSDDPTTKKIQHTWITDKDTSEIDDVTDFDNVK